MVLMHRCSCLQLHRTSEIDLNWNSRLSNILNLKSEWLQWKHQVLNTLGIHRLINNPEDPAEAVALSMVVQYLAEGLHGGRYSFLLPLANLHLKTA